MNWDHRHLPRGMRDMVEAQLGGRHGPKGVRAQLCDLERFGTGEPGPSQLNYFLKPFLSLN